jgi:hypothetical protein
MVKLALVLAALLGVAACSLGGGTSGGSPGASPTESGPVVVTKEFWGWTDQGPCAGPSAIHLQLTVGGAKAGDRVVGTMLGPGLPGTLDTPLDANLSVDTSWPIPKGSGLWAFEIKSVGGKAPAMPQALRTKTSTATCNG